MGEGLRRNAVSETASINPQCIPTVQGYTLTMNRIQITNQRLRYHLTQFASHNWYDLYWCDKRDMGLLPQLNASREHPYFYPYRNKNKRQF